MKTLIYPNSVQKTNILKAVHLAGRRDKPCIQTFYKSPSTARCSYFCYLWILLLKSKDGKKHLLSALHITVVKQFKGEYLLAIVMQVNTYDP